MILKDKKIEMFIVVKGGKHPVHDFQEEFHERLRDMGFVVKIENI